MGAMGRWRLRRMVWLSLIAAVLILTGCSAGGENSASHNATTSTPAATATTEATPTATATAGLPTPLEVPQGWQVYHAPHFAISYPAGWTETTQTQGNSTPSQPVIAYAFTPPDGSAFASVTESDNVDAATIQGTYCKNTSGDQTVTFGGELMRFSQQTGGYRTRSWVLITNAGTVYQLYANDFLASASDYTNRVAQNTAVLSTFQAQYTTPGCA